MGCHAALVRHEQPAQVPPYMGGVGVEGGKGVSARVSPVVLARRPPEGGLALAT